MNRLYSSVKCISVCPGWVQTNILSSDWVGRAIKYNSYAVQDVILSAMGAMFDPSLRGGEFVANQIFDIIWLLMVPQSLGVHDQIQAARTTRSAASNRASVHAKSVLRLPCP